MLSLGIITCNKVKKVERTESKDEAKVSLQFPEAKNQGLEVLYHVKLHLEGWPSPCVVKLHCELRLILRYPFLLMKPIPLVALVFWNFL